MLRHEMRRIAAVALALGALVAVGGCGAGPRASVQRGHAVFANSCAACHTLVGRDNGRGGGDLVNVHLSVADLASFAKVMPVHPRLSSPDALAVAEYVHAVSQSTARRRPRVKR